MSHTCSLRRERIDKVPNPITPTLFLFQLIEPLTLEILTSAIRERDSNSSLFLTLYPSFQTVSIWAQSQAHLIMTSESIIHTRPSLYPLARQFPIPTTAFLKMFIFSFWKEDVWLNIRYLYLFLFLKSVITYSSNKTECIFSKKNILHFWIRIHFLPLKC